MQIENQWTGEVDNRILELLSVAVRRRMKSGVPRGAYLPTEVCRYEVVKKYNRYGKALFDFVEHIGLENTRSTKPKDLDNIDVFWHDCFLWLNEDEQTIILSYLDPLDEFKSIKDDNWNALLAHLGFRNNGAYNKALRICMIKLQKLAEEKKLVKEMVDGVVETWEGIADFMNRSVPTVKKMAMDEKNPLPVSIIGGIAVSTKTLLSEYVQKQISDFPYYKTHRRSKEHRLAC